MNIPDIILHISKTCQQAGGTVWLVGGCVRDMFLGVPPKDWDLEVHNLSGTELSVLLKKIGPCSRVGKSFSVFKMILGNEEIDIALPQNGIEDAPHMGIEEALRRRDLTMNAIAYNIAEEKFFDPFHGQRDIEQRILRATDANTFIEDPLRPYRVAQFAARFSFDIDKSLIELCRSISVQDIPSERIQTELHKMWQKSPIPSIGLLVMEQLNLFSPFPLWKDPTHPNILRAIDRFATQKQQYNTADSLCIFWLCTLHRLLPNDIEILLNTLKVHSINKVVVYQRIIPIITHYQSLLSNPTDSKIREFAEHSSLSWSLPIVALLLDDNKQLLLNEITKKAKRLGVWEGPLPILLPAKELMELGYVGKEIGIALHYIRKQQILGNIQTAEDAQQLLRNK